MSVHVPGADLYDLTPSASVHAMPKSHFRIHSRKDNICHMQVLYLRLGQDTIYTQIKDGTVLQATACLARPVALSSCTLDPLLAL